MLWGIVAFICIILGFVAGFVPKGDELLFEPVVWFVAAIAFNTLSLVIPKLSRGTD